MIGDGEEVKAKDEESSATIFMTEDQKRYIAAMKKASTKKPLKSLPRPFWKPQAIVFGIGKL